MCNGTNPPVCLLICGLLIPCAFLSVSVLVIRMHKSFTNGSINREESTLEENDNKCGRSTRIFIPNVLARWPWSRRINPNYAVLKKEAGAWITSFQAFSSKGQDAFNRCEFGKSFPSYSVRPTNFCLIVLFACLVYPVARKGRVTADTLIKLFAQTVMQSMLELVVISCIYSGCSTSILIGPPPPRSVNKRT